MISWLGQPECHERTLVGGKAAHLSRLAAAFRVPPGFCLTCVAFDQTRAGSIATGQTMRPVGLPAALGEALTGAYTLLAERCGVDAPRVAVRSSALDEDGASSSFAGQHATFLNVVGAEAVAEAVLRCWESAGSARAQAYRSGQGFVAGGTRMAVLVQQFVDADSAAVVFSANPVTGSRDELVVNASWGLGESIVGGTVTPDTYRVRATDLAIISRQIAVKRRMTVSIPEGTREVDVPRFLQLQPTLSDEQVAELGRLGRDLEAAIGGPVDVECAYYAGRLYLLQCRPITALPGSPGA
jgi:pyruvate,water dikinase